ncbi:MAG: methylmalonyl-CoA mutase [Chloroflexi bacterium]|nr:methylmalonyl-CoA mutase [Chloroflexota bacterium]
MDAEEIGRRKQQWSDKNRIPNVPRAGSEIGDKIDPLYTPADVAQEKYIEDIGFPGEYPFTRGSYPAMYRTNLWQMRPYSGFGTAETTNKRWKYLLAHGASGLLCAFDLPTHLGMDSDHPQAVHEVGRVGVAIDTLKDMEILFDGIPIEKASTTLQLISLAPVMLAMYVAVAEKRGTPLTELRGNIPNDPLIEYVCRGTWIYPPGPSVRLACDAMEYCIQHVPKFSPVAVRGGVLREGGADMVQEIAYAFPVAFTYMDNLLKRGHSIEEVASRVTFYLGVGPEFLEEAAVLRGARRLWARTMKERYGAKTNAALSWKFSGSVYASYFRAREPENNLARGAFGLLGLLLGGAQGAFLPALDESYAIPTEKTARLALRTMQVCAYETGITKTIDPLGGSYYIEALTDKAEKQIARLVREVEESGGIVHWIEKGYVQKKCADNAYRLVKDEESGEKVVVAVNKFEGEEEGRPFEIHKADETTVARQIDRLNRVRSERDNAEVAGRLEALQQAAKGTENLLPYLVSAVKAYASVGEITEALKKEFGVFREPSETF